MRCLATSLAAPFHRTHHGLNLRRSYATERPAATATLTPRYRFQGDLLLVLPASQ